QQVERLRFDVTSRSQDTADSGQKGQSRPGKAAAPLTDAIQDRPDLGAPLDPRYTFGNFVVGKPNELSHAAARRVSEGGPVGVNPLFLYGGVGLGKTHLMHAIAHAYQQRDPSARVL